MSTSRPKPLDLNLLHIVLALQDKGSVSAAARALKMSQPAVSGALAKLRDYFNDQLFVRSERGMAPTPRGSEVAEIAREVLRKVNERLKPSIDFDPLAPQRPFTFAMSDVGEMVFLPKLVKACQQFSPDTTLRAVSMRPQELVVGLSEGEVDLAVGYFPDLEQIGFYKQRLYTHRFVLLIRRDHPVQSNPLTMDEFLSLPHAVVQCEGRSQELFESYLQSQGLQRHVVHATPHFQSLPRLIATSDMVVAVPHAIGLAYAQSGSELRAVAPPFPSPRIALHQHWHGRFHHDARNVWLRHLVARLFNDDNDDW